jgi:hypothetical protein
MPEREWRLIMSEAQVEAENETGPKHGGRSLMARAFDERWSIPEGLRGPLIERLGNIVRDPASTSRDVLAAAGALMAASKINLANIATTINVHCYEELEQRMDELEQHIASTRNEKSN